MNLQELSLLAEKYGVTPQELIPLLFDGRKEFWGGGGVGGTGEGRGVGSDAGPGAGSSDSSDSGGASDSGEGEGHGGGSSSDADGGGGGGSAGHGGSGPGGSSSDGGQSGVEDGGNSDSGVTGPGIGEDGGNSDEKNNKGLNKGFTDEELAAGFNSPVGFGDPKGAFGQEVSGTGPGSVHDVGKNHGLIDAIDFGLNVPNNKAAHVGLGILGSMSSMKGLAQTGLDAMNLATNPVSTVLDMLDAEEMAPGALGFAADMAVNMLAPVPNIAAPVISKVANTIGQTAYGITNNPNAAKAAATVAAGITSKGIKGALDAVDNPTGAPAPSNATSAGASSGFGNEGGPAGDSLGISGVASLSGASPQQSVSTAERGPAGVTPSFVGVSPQELQLRALEQSQEKQRERDNFEAKLDLLARKYDMSRIESEKLLAGKSMKAARGGPVKMAGGGYMDFNLGFDDYSVGDYSFDDYSFDDYSFDDYSFGDSYSVGDYFDTDYSLIDDMDFSGYEVLDGVDFSDWGSSLSDAGITSDIGLDYDYQDVENDIANSFTDDALGAVKKYGGKALAWMANNPDKVLAMGAAGAGILDALYGNNPDVRQADPVSEKTKYYMNDLQLGSASLPAGVNNAGQVAKNPNIMQSATESEPTYRQWMNMNPDGSQKEDTGPARTEPSTWQINLGGMFNEGGSVVADFGVDEMTREGYAMGGGSGRDDTIPARLSDGEYVIDAETVALLGDGSSKHGALMLDNMRRNIRKHKGKELMDGDMGPEARSPLSYFKGE